MRNMRMPPHPYRGNASLLGEVNFEGCTMSADFDSGDFSSSHDWGTTVESYETSAVVGGQVGQEDQDLPIGHNAFTWDSRCVSGFDVRVRLDKPAAADGIHQTGPLVLANHESVDELLMGIHAATDVSISTTPVPVMFMNAFRTLGAVDQNDIFDDTQYRAYSIQFPVGPGSGPIGANQWYRTVVDRANGLMAFYGSDDGVTWQRHIDPTPIPAGVLDNTEWGARTIYAPWPIPDDDPLFTKPYYPYEHLSIHPFNDSLQIVDPPTIVYGAGVETAGAVGSIALPYPAGVQSGDRLGVFLFANSGAINLSSAGWSSLTSGTSIPVRAMMFQRDALADGTEVGTVTFTRAAGTAQMCGVMFRLRGQNPVATLSAARLQNASSATITAPSYNVTGMSKLALWAAFVPVDEAVTIPANFDLDSTVGSGGGSGKIVCASSTRSNPTGENNAETHNGSVSPNAVSVCVGALAHPDPR